MSEESKPKFIVGKCAKCGGDIDNAVEGYIIDAEGNLYHEKCYAEKVGG